MSEQFKIDPKTRSLADRMTKLLEGKIDDKGDFTKEAGDTVFRTIATEDGRNVDQMIDDDNYRGGFISAITLAAGEVSRDHMKKNKDLPTIRGSFEIGRSSLDVSFERHQRVPNRVLDKETGNFKVDGEKDLYGDAKVKYAQHGAKNSRGELKQIREHLQYTFTSAFSS